MRGLKEAENCLDFLNRRIPSKNWEQAILQGQITRQNQKLLPGDILKSSDTLMHTYLEDPEPAVTTDIQIIYEDEALLVIDKPAGLPVHPCGRYHFNTLTHIAKSLWPNLTLRPVHRLDSETSGLLILAKTKQAAQNLSQQFEQRTVDKTYLALLNSVPEWQEITCNTAISIQKGEKGRRFCDPNGQPAMTELKYLSTHGEYALIQAKPISGRTNQIRVHLENLGFSIVGDSMYGPETQKRLHLHAWKISFRHPNTGELVQLESTSFQIPKTLISIERASLPNCSSS